MKRAYSIFFVVTLLSCVWISLNTGITKLHGVLNLLLGHGEQSEILIAQEIRAPRVLAAILVGFVLGVCGALSQGGLRNPLAEPILLGTTGGAALFSIFAITFFKVNLGSSIAIGCGILGALLATVVTFYIGNQGKNTLSFIITGIAVSSILTAAVGILVISMNKPEAKGIIFWALGTLSMATKNQVMTILPIIFITCILAILIAPNLDYLGIGDERARHLGKNVRAIKLSVFVIIAIGMGCITSIFGQISFLSLAVPHITRAIFGVKHRSLVINSGIIGAILLIISDLIARSAAQPNEIPIGFMTALIGAPILILAAKKWSRSHA
jgi:iron complex transport system permease protein